MDKIAILIVENNAAGQSALRQVLDAEGWTVQVASSENEALRELSSGQWTMVIANIGLIGLCGPLYSTLKELALAPASESEKARLRVLFLVPEVDGPSARAVLENDRLPYVLKPFHFQDFLEKVSELLLETNAITAPIRSVRFASQALSRRRERHGSRMTAAGQSGRNTGMFSNREDYGMTEEEIAEYEKQDAEETQRKKKKKPEFSGS